MELEILANLSINGLSVPRPDDHKLLMSRYKVGAAVSLHSALPPHRTVLNASPWSASSTGAHQAQGMER